MNNLDTKIVLQKTTNQAYEKLSFYRDVVAQESKGGAKPKGGNVQKPLGKPTSTKQK